MTNQAPSLEEPWLAGMYDAISNREQPLYIYLLVDEEGASLIAEGKLPAYVRVQAQRALDWNLSDVHASGRPAVPGTSSVGQAE